MSRHPLLATLAVLHFPVAPVLGDTPDLAVALTELGDPRFNVREEATRRLERLGPAVLPACAALAEQTHDREVAERARRIMRRVVRHLEPTLENVAVVDRLVDGGGTRLRVEASFFRIRAITATMAARRPSRSEVEGSVATNEGRGHLESAIAGVRLLRSTIQEGAEGDQKKEHEELLERERKLLALHAWRDWARDDLGLRERRQIALRSIQDLSATDVTGEVSQLLREHVAIPLPFLLSESTPSAPVLPGDLTVTNVSQPVLEVVFARDLAALDERFEDARPSKAMAGEFLGVARRLVGCGLLDRAHRMATEIESWDVAYGLFDDRPSPILAEIERMRTASNDALANVASE